MVLRYCGHCKWKDDMCFELYHIRGVRSVNDCTVYEESEYSKYWREIGKRKEAEKETATVAAPCSALQSSLDTFFK